MHISRIMTWVVWFTAAIFYAYQYVLRVMPNVIMPDILEQFQIDTATFGQFSGVYYIGYSLAHLPLGILLDRFGPKRVMPVCILLTTIGLLPILLTEFWVYPILGRALIGIGSSAAILGTFKIIHLTFTEAKFTRMLSLAVTVGLIGAIYGGEPLHHMCQMLGYKTVIGIFVGIGFCLSAVTYFVVPTLQNTTSHSVTSDLKEVFGISKILWICLFAGFMVGPLEGFADVWGVGFLKQAYGLDGATAAGLTSLIFVGMCFGAPVLGLIAEKSGNYFATIVVSGIVMAASFFALLSGMLPLTYMGIVFVAVGVCCAYQILAIYKASTYVKEHVVGLTTAATNMIIMIFGYAVHSLIGFIIHTTGAHKNPQSFSYGISIIPIMLTIGTFGFFVLWWKEKSDIQTSTLYSAI